METKIVIFTIAVWLVFMVVAIVNAGIRNQIFKPNFGELSAHQISSVTFIIAIITITYFALRVSQISLTTPQSIYVGLAWLTLTILFEFVAGHYVFGNPWQDLFMDYNLLKGRVWSLVLLVILISPYLSSKLQ
jgi:hypothetical protein